ncbi:recombinase family protein [Streptomyces kronopolitis]|uniref:recombinase family protein n=1 Tax=Streptomyces kronopolitis TaxID=1612435 RepID=UPI003426CCD4
MVLRPEPRQLLADLASGVIDGVIFYDLDRLVRQPRDLKISSTSSSTSSDRSPAQPAAA